MSPRRVDSRNQRRMTVLSGQSSSTPRGVPRRVSSLLNEPPLAKESDDENDSDFDSSDVSVAESDLTDRLLAGVEGFTLESTYFDIFDNLLAKRVADMNFRD